MADFYDKFGDEMVRDSPRNRITMLVIRLNNIDNCTRSHLEHLNNDTIYSQNHCYKQSTYYALVFEL